MKLIFYFIFTFIVTSVFSQNTSTKIVVDSRTGKPIEDVMVIYGNGASHCVYTDSLGRFSIVPEPSNDIVFRGISFHTKTVSASELETLSCISLEPNDIELAAIEITPIKANELLAKAIYNTKANMLIDVPLKYQLTLKQEERNSGDFQEIKLKYLSFLEKCDPKKKEIPYKLQHLEMDSCVCVQKKSEAKSLEKNKVSLKYHFKSLNDYYVQSHFKIKLSESSDDQYFIITGEPPIQKPGEDIGYKFYINKADTTIATIFIDAEYNREERKYKSLLTFKYKINRIETKISFECIDQKYFMSLCRQFVNVSIIHRNKQQEELSFYSNTQLIGFDDNLVKSNSKLAKLNGSTHQIFNMFCK